MSKKFLSSLSALIALLAILLAACAPGQKVNPVDYIMPSDTAGPIATEPPMTFAVEKYDPRVGQTQTPGATNNEPVLVDPHAVEAIGPSANEAPNCGQTLSLPWKIYDPSVLDGWMYNKLPAKIEANSLFQKMEPNSYEAFKANKNGDVNNVYLFKCADSTQIISFNPPTGG